MNEEVILKAKQGDNEAIVELIKSYEGELTNLARMYSKTNEDAKDAVQNTFIRMITKLSSLEDNSKFDSWIKQITVNEAKRIVMSSYNQKNTMFSDLDNEEESINYDPEDEKIENQPEMAYDKKETSEIVLSILNRLSEDQRIVALMHFYENKTLKEIAEELEIPQSTVIGRIQTAKKNIKASVLELENKEGIKLYNMAPLPFFVYLLHLSQGMPIPTSLIRTIPEVEVEPTSLKSEPTEVLKPQGEPEVLRPNVNVEIPQSAEPVKPITQPTPQRRFDPMTGKPIVSKPEAPVRKFDPKTGKPIGESTPVQPVVDPTIVTSSATSTATTVAASTGNVVSGIGLTIMKVLLGGAIIAVGGFGGNYIYNSVINDRSKNEEITEKNQTENDYKWLMVKKTRYSSDGAVSSITEYEYDEYGNEVKEKNNHSGLEPYTFITEYEYDSNGKILKSMRGLDGDDKRSIVTYEYDENDNLIKTNSNNVADISWSINEYDSQGYLIKIRSGRNNDELYSETYEYNEKGHLIKTTIDLFGRMEYYTYENDDNGKPTKVTYYGDDIASGYNNFEYDENYNLSKEIRFSEEGIMLDWTDYEWIPLEEYLKSKEDNNNEEAVAQDNKSETSKQEEFVFDPKLADEYPIVYSKYESDRHQNYPSFQDTAYYFYDEEGYPIYHCYIFGNYYYYVYDENHHIKEVWQGMFPTEHNKDGSFSKFVDYTYDASTDSYTSRTNYDYEVQGLKYYESLINYDFATPKFVPRYPLDEYQEESFDDFISGCEVELEAELNKMRETNTPNGYTYGRFQHDEYGNPTYIGECAISPLSGGAYYYKYDYDYDNHTITETIRDQAGTPVGTHHLGTAEEANALFLEHYTINDDHTLTKK